MPGVAAWHRDAFGQDEDDTVSAGEAGGEARDRLQDAVARLGALQLPFLHQLPQFTVSPDLPALDGAPETLDVGSTVGPYRLLGLLGRGGMSTVWIGERIDGMLKRRVAVKLPRVAWAVAFTAISRSLAFTQHCLWKYGLMITYQPGTLPTPTISTRRPSEILLSTVYSGPGP